VFAGAQKNGFGRGATEFAWWRRPRAFNFIKISKNIKKLFGLFYNNNNILISYIEVCNYFPQKELCTVRKDTEKEESDNNNIMKAQRSFDQ
jgi:hypothetical protein